MQYGEYGWIGQNSGVEVRPAFFQKYQSWKGGRPVYEILIYSTFVAALLPLALVTFLQYIFLL